jgi:hypothetical protein
MSAPAIDLGGTAFVLLWLCLLWKLFSRKYQNNPDMGNLCARLFLAGIVLAAVAEFTLFNWPHYLDWWADGSAVYTMKDFMVQEDEQGTEVQLKNLGRKLTSLHIDLSSGQSDKQQLEIIYKDEESTRQHMVVVYASLLHSHYVPVLSHGRVSEIAVYSNEKVQVKSITINSEIPLNVFVLRIVLLGVLLFLSFLFMIKKTRRQLKILLFDIPLCDESKAQKRLYWLMVFSVIIFCFFTICMDRQAQRDMGNDPHAIYPLMVDSFMAGHLYLDTEVSPDLLNSPRPYDPADRRLNGIRYMSDHAYYNGRYYSYFGVVPALILFLPFKFITGQHLSASFAVFVFAALACLALALLWQEIARRFMRGMPFFFYCLGALSLVICSGVLWLCRHSAYEIAISSALMFSALGFWLFLRAFTDPERVRRLFFLAALSFALAIGCRPTAVFISLLVPVFAWYGIGYMKEQASCAIGNMRYSVLACLVIPYVLIAFFLMWYNYARFDSVIDFGAFNQMTGANMKALSLANPAGKLLKIIYGFQAYLFGMPEFSAHFPFVSLKLDIGAHVLRYDTKLPVYLFSAPVVGMMNFPILWFLFKIRSVCGAVPEKDGMLRMLLLVMMGIGFTQIAVIILNGGVLMRYAADFLWIFSLSALICAYFTYKTSVINNVVLGKAVLKMIYVFCIFSIVLWIFLSFMIYPDMPHDNRMDYTHLPVFHYLKSFFSL